MPSFVTWMKPRIDSLSAQHPTWRTLPSISGTALDLSLSQLRVIVHDNPFARIQLPPELFLGPYDERYSGQEGRITRVFCGNELAALEKEVQETK
jgi:hypothetical protein